VILEMKRGNPRFGCPRIAQQVSNAFGAERRNPARAHQQRGQSEHQAIEGGKIRSAMAGAIADEQLMLQQ
jgi:hypothetical protein